MLNKRSNRLFNIFFDGTVFLCLIAGMKKISIPRPYGRQAAGKTVKSMSLDADVVAWIDGQAAAAGVSASAFVNQMLKQLLPAPKAKPGKSKKSE